MNVTYVLIYTPGYVDNGCIHFDDITEFALRVYIFDLLNLKKSNLAVRLQNVIFT